MSEQQNTADQASRRDQILAAVLTIFVRHGFKGSSMRDICAAAQLSPGALYRYFPSKDDIVEAIILQDRSLWAARFELAAETGGFFEALDYLAASAMRGAEVDRLRLWLEIAAEASRSERIAKALSEHNEQMSAIITQLAEQAVASGELSTTARPREISIFVLSTLDGLLLRRVTDLEFDFRRSLRSVMMMLRQALGAKAMNARLPTRDQP